MTNVKDVMIRSRDRRIAELEEELRVTKEKLEASLASNAVTLEALRQKVRGLMDVVGIDECTGVYCDG